MSVRRRDVRLVNARKVWHAVTDVTSKRNDSTKRGKLVVEMWSLRVRHHSIYARLQVLEKSSKVRRFAAGPKSGIPRKGKYCTPTEKLSAGRTFNLDSSACKIIKRTATMRQRRQLWPWRFCFEIQWFYLLKMLRPTCQCVYSCSWLELCGSW